MPPVPLTKFIDDTKIFGFVTYLGWRRTARVLLDVSYGNLGKAEKPEPVRLGGLRKAL